MRLYPGWPRTLLANVKPTTRRFGLIFEAVGGRCFLEIGDKKGGSFDARPASSSALQALVVNRPLADLYVRRDYHGRFPYGGSA
jgi:hypothetical protein